MPCSRSQQGKKTTATIEAVHDLSRASLDEQLLAHTGGPGGEEAHRAMHQGIGGSSNASKMNGALCKHWLRRSPIKSSW